jgi:hypothetical protein
VFAFFKHEDEGTGPKLAKQFGANRPGPARRERARAIAAASSLRR